MKRVAALDVMSLGDHMPPLMNKRQFATFLGISATTLDIYRKLGLIHSIKVRGTVRFTSSQVLDFLQRHQEAA
jgi:predicted site-specific integrase-resolvase